VYKKSLQKLQDRQELNLKLGNISFAFVSQYSETPILQTGSVSNKMSANPELSTVFGHLFLISSQYGFREKSDKIEVYTILVVS